MVRKGILQLLDKSASLQSLIRRTWATFIFRRPSVFIFKRQPREYKPSMVVGKPLYNSLS